MLAFDDLLEVAHSVCDLHVRSGNSGEDLSHVERLREEALHLARPRDGELVLFGELVDAEDGDDVLQVLVALQDALDPLRHIVVILPDHARSQNART